MIHGLQLIKAALWSTDEISTDPKSKGFVALTIDFRAEVHELVETVTISWIRNKRAHQVRVPINEFEGALRRIASGWVPVDGAVYK